MNEENQHNDFESLCAGYVFGALEKEEREEFEQMLQNASDEQRHIYEDMRSIKDEFALVTEPVSPSDEVEERIFDGVEKVSDSSKDLDEANIIPLWAYKAAAAILLIGMLGFSYYSINLSETVEQQQAVITELQSELERQEELLNVLAAREVRFVKMDGLDPSPEGYGKILWDPENRQAILQLANLPTPPEGKDYQLWLIKDSDNPIPAGVFNFDRSASDLFFKVENLDQEPAQGVNTFAVTLEPEGGVPQPTGDMFLVGEQS